MTKAVVLCAGYATRLLPLTENRPKPLLLINEKPILEYIIDKISEIPSMNEIIVVSNKKFFTHFQEWKENFQSRIPLKIFNDNSTTNENRLGALRDLSLVLKTENINENFLVIAGDNLINFSLNDFYKKFRKFKENTIAVYDIKDIEKVRRRHGVVLIDERGLIKDFQEKPEFPKSTLKSICCYFFKPETKNFLEEYLQNGDSDATGNFIEWLIHKSQVYAYQFREPVYDIGNLESYNEVKKIFEEHIKFDKLLEPHSSITDNSGFIAHNIS